MTFRVNISLPWVLILLIQLIATNAQTVDKCHTPVSALALTVGSQVLGEYQVQGTQNYTCDPSTNKYTLLGIESQMCSDGKVVGFGLSTPMDGDQGIAGIYYKTDPVTNETIGSIGAIREDLAVATILPDSLPWFVRRATVHTGVFADAQYIWRMMTSGGALTEQEKNCTAGKSNVLKIPYNATFTVYKCPGTTVPITKSSVGIRTTSSVLILALATVFFWV